MSVLVRGFSVAGLAAGSILGLPFVGLITGCGQPGAPQAPSLKLPEPVVDLTAVRAGHTVSLHWTMPKKTTDHLMIAAQIRGPVAVRICTRLEAARGAAGSGTGGFTADRGLNGAGACQTAGETALEANAEAQYTVRLPESESVGSTHLLLYYVEVRNKAGQSAGLSNAAGIAAGSVPDPVSGLTAEVRADGVALHWNADDSGTKAAVRLHRTLLNPPVLTAKASEPAEGRTQVSGPSTTAKPGGIFSSPSRPGGASPEPPVRDLLVEANDSGLSGALDASARFGEMYEYTAQRVENLAGNLTGTPTHTGAPTLDVKALELDGAVSAAVRVDVVDVFPPAVPQGLATIAVEEEKSIDLSWQPDSEDDLAGYIVYRKEDTESGVWERVSGLQPIVAPAYRDVSATAGHVYRYAVTAIDLTGHESLRSTESKESLPNPQ